VGPSTGYDISSVLDTGEQTPVVGRNDTSDWWYIQDPKNASSNCWVWSGSTQVTGDTSALPVVAAPFLSPIAPALPAGGFGPGPFSLLFSNFAVCGDLNFAVFQVTNNSALTFVSGRVNNKMQLPGSSQAGPLDQNGPISTDPNVCVASGNVLPPGATGYIGGWLPPIVPGGTSIHTTVTLCDGAGLEGTCLQGRTNFTAPLSMNP
jgi:hypothetical protein